MEPHLASAFDMLLDVASSAAVTSSGESGTWSLIKLQSYNGTDSLKTFLAKFQQMAHYLR